MKTSYYAKKVWEENKLKKEKIMEKKSKFLSVDTKDAIKAFIVAVLGSVMGLIQVTLDAGSLTFDWKAIGLTALAAAGAYILKNWLSNSDDKFLSSEKK